MNSGSDDRSPISKAVATASQITTIGMMMVLPAIGGYFLDQWLGTYILFVIVGLFFGMAAAAVQLSRLVHHLNPDSSQSDRSQQDEGVGGNGPA